MACTKADLWLYDNSNLHLNLEKKANRRVYVICEQVEHIVHFVYGNKTTSYFCG